MERGSSEGAGGAGPMGWDAWPRQGPLGGKEQAVTAVRCAQEPASVRSRRLSGVRFRGAVLCAASPLVCPGLLPCVHGLPGTFQRLRGSALRSSVSA